MCKCKTNCGCAITSTTKGEKGDASSEASLGYKLYVALLTQSGTAAPVPTVLTNTLGVSPVWSRTGAGIYYFTLVGTFPAAKTAVFGNKQIVLMERSSSDAIVVNSFDSDFVTPLDDILTNVPIEIRIYP
jgi:hypothetical protein